MRSFRLGKEIEIERYQHHGIIFRFPDKIIWIPRSAVKINGGTVKIAGKYLRAITA